MAVPAFFIYDHYMAAKLRQLQRNEPEQWRNADIQDVEQAFARSGYIGADGAYRHFLDHGAAEGIDPNPLFNAEEYYTFKAAAAAGVHVSDITPMRRAQAEREILRDSGSAWNDYLRSGMLMYANGSNEFHTGGYAENKLRQLRVGNPYEWGTKTAYDVLVHMQTQELNPVMHYYMFGVDEGVQKVIVPESDRVYVAENLPWDSRESLLRNKVFQLTEWESINNINLPKYIDVLLQVTPACIDDEQSGYGILFNDALVDLKTGTVTEFLLHPRAMQIGSIPLKSFTRKQYNTILDFTFFVEGRYLGFWASLCHAAYRPLLYGEPYFPALEDMEYMFGTSPEGDRTFFYALNWGQAELFDTTQNRILAIYTDGFKNCYWCKPMRITVMDDPRIIRVDVREPLPQIELHRIDVITEYMYCHAKTDELPFAFITNTIVIGSLEIQEDIDYTYDPWLELPPAYPDTSANAGTGVPAEDTTAPILVASTPGTGTANISTMTTLILTFSENIRVGSGSFTLVGPGGTQVYSGSSPYVTTSGRSVVITLHTELQPLTNYSFYGDAASVADLNGNLWSGNINAPIQFQTAQKSIIDTEKPELLSVTPADGAVNVPLFPLVELVFSEDVQAGSGYVVLTTDDNDGDGYADHSVVLPAASFTIDGSTATMRTAEALRRDTEYYITITGTSFRDSWGNFYDGIEGINEIRFRTVNTPLIWYVPDIDRGRSAAEFVLLQEAYGQRISWLEWWPMDSYKNNWSELTEASADGDTRDLFVGAGIGGFYAARLAAHHKGRAYLINPVINPSQQLSTLVGPHHNHDGTEYNLTQGVLNSYNEAVDPRQGHMRNRFNLCVAEDDSVVDYTAAESYYPKYREYWDNRRDVWVAEGWANIMRRLTVAGHTVTDPTSIAAIVSDLRALGY